MVMLLVMIEDICEIFADEEKDLPGEIEVLMSGHLNRQMVSIQVEDFRGSGLFPEKTL